MTYAELYDQVAGATGDDSGPQRINARRWLNLTRSHIADEFFWPSALDASATFTATVKSTSIYTIGNDYDHVAGDWMYNTTDDMVVISEGLALARGVDVDKDTSGPPTIWAPAGMSSAGNYQVYLWPKPSVSTTIVFHGVKRMTTITSADDSSTIDPYFGPIQSWAACFAEGMRYFAFDTDNEDAFAVQSSFSRFQKQIDKRKKRASVAPQSTGRMADVKGSRTMGLGRFDPAHYDNRV